MTNRECDLFLECVLEIGKRFVATGCEVRRVEDTVNRICRAYGFEQCEVYAVTSFIVVTIKNDDGRHFTQSVRVQSSGTDLGRLEQLNAQSRYICTNTPEVNELAEMIRSYTPPKPKKLLKCIGYMLAAGGFAIFFGGGIADGLCAATIAILIYLMDYNFKLKQINSAIYTFVESVVSSCLALMLVHIGIGVSADMITIGDVMLFVPGLQLVNAVKEMFNKDIVTGIYRLVEAVLVALAIGGGIALSYIIVGGLPI